MNSTRRTVLARSAYKKQLNLSSKVRGSLTIFSKTSANVSAAPKSRPFAPLSVAFVGILLAAIAYMSVTENPATLGPLVKENLDISFDFFSSTQFLLFVPLIFLLEYLLPARPEQRGFSPSVVIDAIYMLIHLPVIAALMVLISMPIHDFLNNYASWLVVDSTRSWPVAAAAFVGVVIADLLSWFAHMVKHKVPLFWRFHMIHHSQARLNMFTANRTHPLDAVIETFVLLLPFFFFFPAIVEQANSVFAISLFVGWHVRFQHSNIRTNLGPLRYVFVTPQSHRVHHSVEPHHWNSNYANVFAWDRLFGTQNPDDSTYPATGVNDPQFPEPKTFRITDFATGFVGQLLFPLDRKAVGRASTASSTSNTVS